MEKCKYCNPSKEGTAYGKSLKTDFKYLTLKINGLHGYMAIYGKKESDTTIINYCPMCGRKLEEV